MAIVISNKKKSTNIYSLRVTYNGEVPDPGQFFMLRGWDFYPLLNRPFSVHNYKEGELTFLYRLAGIGTEKLVNLKEGDKLNLYGPYGSGFKLTNPAAAIVAGGIGLAPMLYTAKRQREKFPSGKLTIYLGYTNKVYCEEDFKAFGDVITKVGGFITDELDLKPNQSVFGCGPGAFLDSLMNQVPAVNELQLSFEAQMACGLGACLGCVKKLPLIYTNQNGKLKLLKKVQKKVCTEGPCFYREVING